MRAWMKCFKSHFDRTKSDRTITTVNRRVYCSPSWATNQAGIPQWASRFFLISGKSSLDLYLDLNQEPRGVTIGRITQPLCAESTSRTFLGRNESRFWAQIFDNK